MNQLFNLDISQLSKQNINSTVDQWLMVQLPTSFTCYAARVHLTSFFLANTKWFYRDEWDTCPLMG